MVDSVDTKLAVLATKLDDMKEVLCIIQGRIACEEHRTNLSHHDSRLEKLEEYRDKNKNGQSPFMQKLIMSLVGLISAALGIIGTLLTIRPS